MNSVYSFAQSNAYVTIDQDKISFKELRNHIFRHEIDLIISHSFMKIIPESVFSAPKLGSINIHASLLPKYRGPSPTYWVLKNNDRETGLTCHFINNGIDTGSIISQVKVPLESNDIIDSIIDKHKQVLEMLIDDAIGNLTNPDFKPIRQDEHLASYAPKPKELQRT